MVRIFASELSKCRIVKAIFGFTAFVLFLIVFVVFPVLWFLKAPIEKTSEDFVQEYVHYRMNFTPSTARNAFYNRLQYIHPLYDEIIKDELSFIQRQGIYQYFVIRGIKQIPQSNLFEVSGILVKFSCKDFKMCKKIYDAKSVLVVRKIKRKFAIEEVK